MALGVEQEDGVVRGRFHQEPEPLLAVPQLLLGLLAGGQITGHFREATEMAPVVLEGRDDDVGPKAGAVLADPPALVLEAASRPGDFEFVLRPAPVDGFLRVELCEVLADDLLGPVPLDPLGPGIPGDDSTLRRRA